MAGKNSIQLLRISSNKLSSSDYLLDGQPLYIKDKNYLSIGNDNSTINKQPITTRSIIGYVGDTNTTLSNDSFNEEDELQEEYSIRKNDTTNILQINSNIPLDIISDVGDYPKQIQLNGSGLYLNGGNNISLSSTYGGIALTSNYLEIDTTQYCSITTPAITLDTTNGTNISLAQDLTITTTSGSNPTKLTIQYNGSTFNLPDKEGRGRGYTFATDEDIPKINGEKANEDTVIYAPTTAPSNNSVVITQQLAPEEFEFNYLQSRNGVLASNTNNGEIAFLQPGISGMVLRSLYNSNKTVGWQAVIDSEKSNHVGTSQNLITERAVFYSLPTINGSTSYGSDNTFYAPTTGGTNGDVLYSNGSLLLWKHLYRHYFTFTLQYINESASPDVRYDSIISFFVDCGVKELPQNQAWTLSQACYYLSGGPAEIHGTSTNNIIYPATGVYGTGTSIRETEYHTIYGVSLSYAGTSINGVTVHYCNSTDYLSEYTFSNMTIEPTSHRCYSLF